MERGSLEMPCQVQDMDEDVSVAWYKGDNLLFLDEERLTDDQRYSVTKEGTVGGYYSFAHKPPAICQSRVRLS